MGHVGYLGRSRAGNYRASLGPRLVIGDDDDTSTRIQRGRPPIGPRVDFRVPAEVDAAIRWWANENDVKVDAVYRDLVIASCTQIRIEYAQAMEKLAKLERRRKFVRQRGVHRT